MQFNFLIVRLFYNLTGRKGKESFKKLSIIHKLQGKFFSCLLLFKQNADKLFKCFFSLDQMTLKLLRFEQKQYNFMLNLFRFHLEMVILCGIFITKNDH